MPSVLLGPLRTGAQALVAYLAALAASHGINIPITAQSWLVQLIVVGVTATAWTAAVHWLESRKGDSVPAQLARWVAKVAMFGLSGKSPVYVTPGSQVTVTPPAAVPPPPVVPPSGPPQPAV